MRGSIVLDKGTLTWPPPPISVQAAPPTPPKAQQAIAKIEEDPFNKTMKDVALYSGGI